MYKKLFFVLITVFFCSQVYAADATLGEQIYNKSCKTCHNPNTAPLMKSPVVHDVAAWKLRFKAAEEIAKNNPEKYKSAMDVLVATVKGGKGAMPAGGMCMNASSNNKKCSDAEYVAAIKFMSEKK